MPDPARFPSGRRKIIGSAIRILAGTHASPIVAAGHSGQSVEIWNIGSQNRISAFPTVLEFGGRRLAITPDGSKVTAANYGAAGVACYQADSGNLLWQRKDLRQIQSIGIDPAAATVHCGFDRKPLEILSIEDGATIERLRAVRDCHYSQFSTARLLEKQILQLHLPNTKQPLPIARETFAVLSAEFSRSAVAISESGGPLRCFNLADGSLRWRYAPPEGCHLLRLGYQSNNHRFVGIQWRYSIGGMSELLLFNESTGEISSRFPLESSSDYCFACEGSRLLSSDGWILNTENGLLVGSLDFPVKEYWASQ